MFHHVTSVTSLTFFDRIDVALHVEVLFGYIVVFALENFSEAAHGLSNGYVLSLVAGKDLSDVKWLAEKTLNLACAIYGELILRAQFIHSKNGDDVLKVFVSLQY